MKEAGYLIQRYKIKVTRYLIHVVVVDCEGPGIDSV